MATKKKATAATSNDRAKALDLAMAQIEKDFGKGAVMRLGDDNRPPIQAISTGNIAINVALGIGGFPRGRVVEVYGRSLPVKPRSPFMRLRKHSVREVSLRLLTPSTP